MRLFPPVFQNLLEMKEEKNLFSFRGTSPAIWKLCKYSSPDTLPPPSLTSRAFLTVLNIGLHGFIKAMLLPNATPKCPPALQTHLFSARDLSSLSLGKHPHWAQGKIRTSINHPSPSYPTEMAAPLSDACFPKWASNWDDKWHEYIPAMWSGWGWKPSQAHLPESPPLGTSSFIIQQIFI